MSDTLLSKIRGVFVLQAIAVVFAMLNLSNIKIEYVADFLPLFDVMIIFYFAVLRPEAFRIWFLFLLGIISDSLTNIPLGITSLSYILLVRFFVTINQRTAIQENFHQIFTQFAFFTFLLLFFKWLLMSICYLKFYNFFGPLIQFAVSCPLYVLMHKFFYYLDKRFYQKYAL